MCVNIYMYHINTFNRKPYTTVPLQSHAVIETVHAQLITSIPKYIARILLQSQVTIGYGHEETLTCNEGPCIILMYCLWDNNNK